MKRTAFSFALALTLLGSACRQDDPVATAPTPSVTASATPSPASLLEDFVLEGEVLEAWSAVSEAGNGDPSPSPGPQSNTASPAAANPAGSPAPGTADLAASPGPAVNAASGSVSVRLASYFSESGCAFKAGDLVVVRFTPRTTVEPPEVADDANFPNNLETVQVTISGNLLEPGSNCLPVADSITLLESPSTSAAPVSPSRSNRPRPRARTAQRLTTPTPTPAPAGTSAEAGGSNTGTSDRSNDEDDPQAPKVDDTFDPGIGDDPGTDPDDDPGTDPDDDPGTDPDDDPDPDGDPAEGNAGTDADSGEDGTG